MYPNKIILRLSEIEYLFLFSATSSKIISLTYLDRPETVSKSKTLQNSVSQKRKYILFISSTF